MLEDVHVIHNMHWRSRSPDLRRNGTRSALDLTFIESLQYFMWYFIWLHFSLCFVALSVAILSVTSANWFPGTLTPASTTAMKLLHRLPRSLCQGHNPMKLGSSRWLTDAMPHVLHISLLYFFTIAFIGKNHAVAALLTLCFAHFRESKALALCDKWQGSGKPRSMGPCQKVFTTMALGRVR